MYVKIVLTKRKDDEQTSSTIYNAMNHREPVLDFQSYINDNENIVDEVCLHMLTATGKLRLFDSRTEKSKAVASLWGLGDRPW